ncbi:MAG TPA: peptidase M61 [Gammaproteobacteria bacterium]|nr:peptidase M61 [Gammaproteobacteria bacterium]
MSLRRSALFAAAFLVVGAAAQPRGESLPPSIAEPRDVPYAGVIALDVDASDVTRGIFRVRERIPVAQAGALTLLYPQWLPGKHAPRGAINLLSGIEISAGGKSLEWRRDPVNVYAFHVDVPTGTRALDLTFQFVSPTQTNQGRIVATREMLNLQWEAVLLYPAGYYSSRIRVVPSVKLPNDWRFAAALDGAATNGDTTRFAETDLTTLVDSPLFAGKHYRLVELDRDAERPTRLNLFADRPDQLAATTEQLEPHRNLVQQARLLFGSQHFDRYDFLLALTDRMGGIGLEHHRSTEIAVDSVYFTDWSLATSERDVLPHELVHSWNGKFRRPADLWTPSFETPMRGSLLWVYEGLTQYYGFVLAARSGLWSQQDARAALAMTAATYQHRVGRQWRSVADTTNDPILSARRPAPWRSWLRNEDYYSEGLLVWLDADTLIRERTDGRRSLDDFARAFFGSGDGSWAPVTYTLDDVVAALNDVLESDWAAFFRERIYEAGAEPPLDGVARGGYRLVFKDERSEFQREAESYGRNADLSYSLGLLFGENGNVTGVQWDGLAFNQGVTVGTQVVAVNGVSYANESLRRAVTTAKTSREPIELLLRNGDQYRTIALDYHDGLRYPHLERDEAASDRLADILSPRSP